MAATDLITQCVEPNPHRAGAGEAILRDSGVSVWVLVEAYQALGRDPDRVARKFDVPRRAIDAALAYYSEHRQAVDTKIDAQRAGFE